MSFYKGQKVEVTNTLTGKWHEAVFHHYNTAPSEDADYQYGVTYGGKGVYYMKHCRPAQDKNLDERLANIEKQIDQLRADSGRAMANLLAQKEPPSIDFIKGIFTDEPVIGILIGFHIFIIAGLLLLILFT